MRHWADGGETSLSNLVQICRRHHRLVHEGGFRVRVTGTGDFIFVRPDGVDIEAVPAPPPTTAFDADTLARQNVELGLAIDGQTCVAKADTVDMDYAMAVEGLLYCDEPESFKPRERISHPCER